MTITENIKIIRKNIILAAKKKKVDPSNIILLIAGKKRTLDQISEVVNSGIKVIGENHAQELVSMYPYFEEKVEWHFIGHLQRNKVKDVIPKVQMIHSIDSIRLANTINNYLKKTKKKLKILIEVNTTEEENKNGCKLTDVKKLVYEISKLKHVSIQGLMTMGKNVKDPNENRKYFKSLSNISNTISQMNIPNVSMKYLSMGMSKDYIIAIEEGANIIRIGRGAFITDPNHPIFKNIENHSI